MVTRAANHGRSVLYLRAQAIRIALLFVGVLLVILFSQWVCRADVLGSHAAGNSRRSIWRDPFGYRRSLWRKCTRTCALEQSWRRVTYSHPGQVIRLAPPSGSRASRPVAKPAPAAKRTIPPPPSDPPLGWAWPANGRVMAEFKGAEGAGTGLLIAGKAGQEVRAAANGRVVYAGSGLIRLWTVNNLET